MKIVINQVEGKTTRKGTKQNREYTIIAPAETKGFYEAKSDAGKLVTIWDVEGNWSKIGIMTDTRRMSYTTNFTIVK